MLPTGRSMTINSVCGCVWCLHIYTRIFSHIGQGSLGKSWRNFHQRFLIIWRLQCLHHEKYRNAYKKSLKSSYSINIILMVPRHNINCLILCKFVIVCCYETMILEFVFSNLPIQMCFSRSLKLDLKIIIGIFY